MAGNMPKNKPTAVEKAKARTMAHPGIWAMSRFMFGRLAKAMASNWPNPIPIRPPIEHRTTDSIRNWARAGDGGQVLNLPGHLLKT